MAADENFYVDKLDRGTLHCAYYIDRSKCVDFIALVLDALPDWPMGTEEDSTVQVAVARSAWRDSETDELVMGWQARIFVPAAIS